LRFFIKPALGLKHLWRKFPVGSFSARMRFEAFYKPQYAYGMYRAAKLAVTLGCKDISVIEFGVASGQGLKNMEKIAAELEKIFDISIHVYGFDTGRGLPHISNDYRDLPYLWREGEFPMDSDQLKKELKKARLILGNVNETVHEFIRTNQHPIGFISFDLDLYSSTKSALAIFEEREARLLPRVYSYFDDVSAEMADSNEYAGELLAIKEFNALSSDRKISKLMGLDYHMPLRGSWIEGFYVMHDFKNPYYNSPVL